MASQWSTGHIVDKLTQAGITIDYVHHEIHGGNHYFVRNFITLPINTSLNFAVSTPDSKKEAHMLFHIHAQSEIEVYVYENAIYSAGVAVTPINSHRGSSNTSSMTVVSGPTIASNGTELEAWSSGKESATFFGSAETGFTNRNEELVLAQDTKYLFKIISRGNSNTISYDGNWYEHSNQGVIS